MSRKLKFLMLASCLACFGIVAVVGLAYVTANRRTAAVPPCHDNLMRIELAKYDWASENDKTSNDIPTWDDLRPYLPDLPNSRHWSNGLPVCPAGGTYTIGRVGELPKCSIGGGYNHSLLQ
jgi:hypothetical protein